MDVRERTLGGRYRLEDVIGRGGMSIVYRARDEVLGRTVAVKVLLAALAEQDPSYSARFTREARAAAALASSAVVTVFDTGVDEEGGRYIVMEYVSGHSLAELLADERPLELAESLRIAERVADALRAAHTAGILHRDIKPANVMVADDGAIKVLDFGIAHRVDGTALTQTASVVGTAAYMAPERALGQPGDARADIYSLGCLLYAMLAGRPPFAGDAAAAVLHQQVNSDPVPPSRSRRAVPAALDALVLAMLAKAPEARPQSAAEVRDRLLALSGVAPATAATVPMAAAAGATFAEHRRRAVLVALAVALIAVLALALLSAGGSAKHPARNRATTGSHAVSRPPTAKPKPKPPAPSRQTPPGHGGTPPGQAKHGQGGGGDGGDGG